MGIKYATLKDVARLAGTTPTTVSCVLNEKEGRYISKEMRERVMKAVWETGYVKSGVASSLRGKKRGIIAVLVPQFSNQFFTRMVLAIESVVEKEGYVLSICNTFDDPEREREIMNRMFQQRADGYVIIPTREGHKNTQQARRLGIPMVVVDRPLQGAGESEDYPWITASNYQASSLATEYLIRKGHRNMAYIGWKPGIEELENREKGFWDAVSSAGFTDSGSIAMYGEFSAEVGYRMTEQVLKKYPDITAVFYGFNIQAKGGVQCLTEAGLVPGKDISVILVGSPEWAMVGQNCFAHIDQHEYELGRHASRLLLEIIEKEKQIPRQTVLDCTLCEGSSVKDIRSLVL